MAVLKRRFNESELSARHHLDVLHELSPEITSLIYADNQGLLNSEMRPLLAVFRKLESDEKIALIESTTQMYGYDAQIEINRES